MKRVNIEKVHTLNERRKKLLKVARGIDGSPNTRLTLQRGQDTVDLQCDHHGESIQTFVGILIEEIDALLVGMGVELPRDAGLHPVKNGDKPELGGRAGA